MRDIVFILKKIKLNVDLAVTVQPFPTNSMISILLNNYTKIHVYDSEIKSINQN